MIPLGYMAKFVVSRPDWLKAGYIDDIYSVSPCISKDFCEWIDSWRHNGFWFFDSPDIIREIASSRNVELGNATWFYYEAFEQEFVSDESRWRFFTPEPSFPLDIHPPKNPVPRGIDIVTYSGGNTPGHSPLSCNHMAEELAVNRHCLLDHFDEAKALVDAGCFNMSEPGPYRLVAVHTIDAALQ
ncbi:MAG: hypothetical protein LBI02_05755 [Opitutaceae bacterium]|jgi:hypothetical protein|nr:hypothetical protein [Opitutaceae bacterium]